MKAISEFNLNFTPPTTQKKRTERGDLTDNFYSILINHWDSQKYGKLTTGFIRFKLAKIPTKDLYALVSKMDDATKRGYNPAMAFWGSIKAR